MNVQLEEWEHLWATTPTSARPSVWRAHRIAEILNGNTPRKLAETPTIVVHIVPDTAFAGSTDLPLLDRQLLAPAASLKLPLTRANADGIAAISTEDPAYVQVFHDAMIEYASSDRYRINGAEFSYKIVGEFLSDFFAAAQTLMRWLPAKRTYALSFLHVKNKRFPGTDEHFGFHQDTVLSPMITTDKTDVAADLLRKFARQANGYALT
jgi:hypothetical protein